MKIFKTVKTALSTSLPMLLSLFLGTYSMGSDSAPVTLSPIMPRLECGSYLVQGKLHYHKGSRSFILTLNPETPSPFEVILLGGDPLQKVELLGTYTLAEIRIPNPVQHEPQTQAFVKKISFSAEAKSELTLIRKEPCEQIKKQMSASLK